MISSGTKSTPKFGEQRTVRDGAHFGPLALYHAFGVPDPAHFLHHRYLKAALETLPTAQPRNVLDAGSGPGDHAIWLARRFPTSAVTARDIDPVRVRALASSATRLGLMNLRVELQDLRVLEEQHKYDLIVVIDVLEHIPEQAEVLARLRNALAPGGHIFIHIPTVRPRPVPFHRFLRDFLAWGEVEHTADELTAEGFEAVVRAAGLEVIDSRRTFGYWTGELATSLFALPFRNTWLNRVAQSILIPICRILALADLLGLESTRYALALVASSRTD